MTVLLLWLALLSCVGAIREANYSALLASYTQVCRVELKLRDGYGDGFNGNQIQMKAGPVTADYAVPLIPNTELCATRNDQFGAPTLGTLSDSDYCSFTADIPAGWNVEFDFFWKYDAWPEENFLTLQLSYVQSFFGPVVLSASQFHDLTDAQGQTVAVPYLNPVFSLACGPLPSAVSAIQAAPSSGTGPAKTQTTISWTPVITSGVSSAYAVTVQDLTTNDDPLPLGVYTSSSLEALLWENTNYKISIKALNKFGEGTETSVNYRTHSLPTIQLDAVMFASRPHAWYPEGKLVIYVNNAIVGIGSVQGDAVQSTLSFPVQATGTAITVSVHFVPPTGSAGECSFRILRGTEVLFKAENTIAGPSYYDGYFQVTAPIPPKVCGVCCNPGGCPHANPDGYCCDEGEICCKTGTTEVKPFTCCKGAQKCLTNYTGTLPSPKTCAVPVSTCPDSKPTEGAGCYGSLNCNYNSSCCCPGDADEVCGPTVKFSCTGENGAVWTLTNLSLPCTSDPAFSCPGDCPAQEPVSTQQCLGSRTCLYGKSCCCPTEDDPANQLCTYQRQWKCMGTNGGHWDLTTLVPGHCPDICYSQTKTGECPAAGSCNGGTTGDLCAVDSQCNGTAKCCPGSCGKLCVQPCDCSVTPTCQCWEHVVVTPGPGCCGGTKTCQTDSSSTQCPTAIPDWSSLQCVLAQDQTCGSGKKTRTKNVRDTQKGCVTTTETQDCNVPCPVHCVGAFGACGTCSSTCKGGTCRRQYAISTFAANGGNACPFSAGAYSDPEPCPNLPPCPTYCPIRIVVKDTYGDGFTYGTPKGFFNIYNDATGALLVSQWSSTKINSTALIVATGTKLRINATKDKYWHEAMIQITTNENNVAGAILYQDPVDISQWGVKGTSGPALLAYFTVKCNDCSQGNSQYCLNQEHRLPCSTFGFATDYGCGACAPGYWQSSPSAPCQDVDECAMPYNQCKMANATCNNIPGSFTCTCPTGTNFLFGYCETPGVCPQQRFRMEWFDMTPQQRQLYVKAYKCLSDSGMYQALHNMHSTGAAGSNWPSPFHYGHDHGSGFWYWHATFSLRFEDMVRQCAIERNIPELRCFVGAYWDSASMLLAGDTPQARAQRVKDAFFTSEKVDGNYIGIGPRTDQCDDNHPYNFLDQGGCWKRGPDVDPPNWEPSDVLWSIVATANNIRDLNNLQPKHFAMHPYVGGAFGGVDSARDPLFFLHHNFYDMLWRVWQACKGKSNWATTTVEDHWWANDLTRDYKTDSPMQGFPSYPQDLWDSQNLLVRVQGASSTVTTSVIYSSSSVTRAQASGIYTCPTVIDRYVKAIIPLAPKSNLQVQERVQTALTQTTRRNIPRVQEAEVPLHLWATNNKMLHAESHTEWRENLRRFAGGSHTALERHVNVLAHTWKAPRSELGRAAFLQRASSEATHQEEPTKDIGQQCRELAKSMIGEGVTPNTAYLNGLDCICEKTDSANLPPLPSSYIQLMQIKDVCLTGGCQPTCYLIEGMVHGKEAPEDDKTGNSTDDQGKDGDKDKDGDKGKDKPDGDAGGLIARLTQRIFGN